MSSNRYVYRKSRTDKEYKTGNAVGFLDAVNQVNYGSWFIFLGIDGPLRKLFFAFENYFFLGSFILNSSAAAIYLYSFIHAANKNLYKLSNIAIRAFSLALVLLMMFGTAIVAPSVIMAARIISLFLNPIQYITKLIYFTYKYFTAETPAYKEFFKSKVIENLLGTLISSFIICGIVLLYAAASVLAAEVMIGLSVVGPLVVLAIQTARLFMFMRSDPENAVLNIDQTKQDNLDQTPRTVGNTTARLHLELQDVSAASVSRLHLSRVRIGMGAHLPQKKSISSKLDLHRHSLPKAIDITELRVEVRALKNKLNRHVKLDSWFASMERKKRQDKLAALEFLEVMMKNFDNIQRSATEPVRIGQAFFHYNTIDDLFNQIQNHILNTYPRAFQSFFTNISHTESCFQSLCLLLNEKFLPTPKKESSPVKRR
jgi:hypothetical protein